jgi:hypothetical protein
MASEDQISDEPCLFPSVFLESPSLDMQKNDGSRGLFTQRIALNRSAPIHHDAVMLAEIGGGNGSKSRSISLRLIVYQRSTPAK